MSDNKNKSNDDSGGQNPLWPGEGLKKPGKYNKTSRNLGEGEITEETIIPFVDSIKGTQPGDGKKS